MKTEKKTFSILENLQKTKQNELNYYSSFENLQGDELEQYLEENKRYTISLGFLE